MHGIVRVIAWVACSAAFVVSGRAFAAGSDAATGPPLAVAVDRGGNVFFSTPTIVYRMDRAGTLSRVAGTGRPGYSGDGGRAIDAAVNIAFDPSPPPLRYSYDYEPYSGGVAVDAAGNLYFADSNNGRVRRIDTRGIITTVAGGGHGALTPFAVALDVGMDPPEGVAMDATGNLFFTSYGLWKVEPSGRLVKAAPFNCGIENFRSNGLCSPGQIAVDASGGIYAWDEYCRIRRLRTDGTVSTVAGDERPDAAKGLQFTCGYSGDGGPAVGAALGGIGAVAVDRSGNVYLADTFNHCVRKVDTAGIIATFAGVCGRDGFGGDGGLATAALLRKPYGVAVDADGNVYIADTHNYRIRRVASDGRIGTAAGNGSALPDPSILDLGAIGPGFTGAWYDPAQPGQGLFVEVLPGNRFYAAWLAFDPSGTSQAWFTGVGSYNGNSAHIDDVTQSTGGRWIPNFDPTAVTHRRWGTMTFTFSDCNHGRVDFVSYTGFGAGSMNLTRLTIPSGLTCP